MKKKISIPVMKKFFFTFAAIITAGCFSASAQSDTATIKIDKNKAKEAYHKNNDGRKATVTDNAAKRQTTLNQNQPARQETFIQNKQERKAVTSDGAVTSQEANNLYQNNSNERRTNAKSSSFPGTNSKRKQFNQENTGKIRISQSQGCYH